MPINRNAVHQLTVWNSRSTPPKEERDAFMRMALEMAPSIAQVLGDNSPAPSATVREIMDRRNELRAFQDKMLSAAKVNADKDPSGAKEQRHTELMQAMRACGEALAHCSSLIDFAATDAGASARSHAPGTLEVRSGSDWTAAYDATDHETRSAFEGGQLDIAEFCRAIAGMRSSDAAKRALSVGTDSAGGFTVPSILMPEILDALAPVSSLITAGASIVRVGDEGDGGKSFNWAAVQTLPTAGWRNEAGTVVESDPVFRNVQATPRSLAFMFRVSRELLMDGNGLRSALNRAIGAAFAVAMDRAGLRGTGTAPEPRGILTTAGIQSVTNGANGASLAATRWGNLMSAYQAIIAADAPAPTAAIMAPRSLIAFGNLADTTNQPLQRPDTLRNLQFVATSQLPVSLSVGTSTDCTEIYVGDFRGVRFVMREQPSIALLTERYADTGQVAFVCHARVDVLITYPAQFAVVTGVRA